MGRRIIQVLIVIGVSVLVGLLVLVGFFGWASSASYPRDRYAELVTFNNKAPAILSNEATIVTYNIGYLSGLTNNQAVQRDAELFTQNLQTVLTALSRVQPDIIGLQEIDIASRRSFGVNQVTALAEGLSLTMGAIAINWDKRYVPFPYFPPSAHFGRVVSGQAILSRYPIQTHERVVLESVPTHPFWYRAFYLDRLAQVSQIQLGNQPIVVINV
ncbi:MAG: endonuclease/exonuclease/phosphatase family protein, partial [Cyanobacteria bacterium]|nr:endonuclease/exonuclease/phosphatase family protein [Cyanobacteriota bacterium]